VGRLDAIEGFIPAHAGAARGPLARESVRGFIPARAGAAPPGLAPTPPAWVHPCASRGGIVPAYRLRQLGGSSLRVQGRLPKAHGQDAEAGFIPARAGAASGLLSTPSTSWVHPCACRGGLAIVDSVKSVQGSSLRVQGRPCLQVTERQAISSIDLALDTPSSLEAIDAIVFDDFPLGCAEAPELELADLLAPECARPRYRAAPSPSRGHSSRLPKRGSRCQRAGSVSGATSIRP
jgi:hypothetical protein